MTASGFELKGNLLTIDKDIESILSYAFDWSDWLQIGDTISTVDYNVQARLNDPNPIVIEDSGVAADKTFCYLSGGQLNKSYQVSCKILTTMGLTERRIFSVNVVNRSA
jgi:hypothetical protein